MANLSIKSKLLIMLLGVSLGSIALVATLNYRQSYETLREAVTSHLTSVRATRASAIEQYIETIISELEVLAASTGIGDMVLGFAAALAELEEVELNPEELATLDAFYREEFLPELDAMVEGTPEFMSVFPEFPAARYLQYHYIATNPFPPGNRLQLDDPGDGSNYSALHKEMHPNLRRIASGFGYYDLFLIDLMTGRILYTTAKEVDLGTNLASGTHAQSNLARLFREVQRKPDRGAARIIDFEHYRPSLGAPAMFAAAPVFKDGRPVGVVAVQESTQALERVITGNRQWERDGFGKTGETVIIGPDFRLRSPSRFLIEDPEGYAADQRAIGTDDESIERILHLGSPVLEQEVRTVAAEQALHGQTGTGVIVDYRGREILGSWAPLKVEGLDWAIVGKVDLAEAFAPIHELARNTLVQTMVILAGITLLVMLLAAYFVRPVNDLISRVQRFGAGDREVEFDGEATDEIGDLARSFRGLVETAREQTQLIEEVSKENTRLMKNMLPRRFADQVQQGTGDVTETIPEVSVIFAELRGLALVTRTRSANDCVLLLKEFLAAADEAAAQHKTERVKTMGDTYMAAVGLSAPLLDHAQRALDFARALKGSVELMARAHGLPLQLIVGIADGPVVTNVIHDRELVFNLWGEAVIEADHARDCAAAGQIVVTNSVKEVLEARNAFERVSGEGPQKLWSLSAD